MNDSNYFKDCFKSLKKPIPPTLQYAGVKHNDLIKNIKDDVNEMARIEKSAEAGSMMKKAMYLAFQGRLEKVLKRLLELEKE
jgi:hypothetical protein